MTNYKEEYQHWLDSPALSEEEWKELNSISGDEKEIESRFFAPLEFGTAGLRGTMKLGLHNMNIHIIRHATQAFANVILEEGMDAAERGIAIAHDCRINSRRFAEEAACVMAANGIRVRLFESLRPTPELRSLQPLPPRDCRALWRLFSARNLRAECRTAHRALRGREF